MKKNMKLLNFIGFQVVILLFPGISGEAIAQNMVIQPRNGYYQGMMCPGKSSTLENNQAPSIKYVSSAPNTKECLEAVRSKQEEVNKELANVIKKSVLKQTKTTPPCVNKVNVQSAICYAQKKQNELLSVPYWWYAQAANAGFIYKNNQMFKAIIAETIKYKPDPDSPKEKCNFINGFDMLIKTDFFGKVTEIHGSPAKKNTYNKCNTDCKGETTESIASSCNLNCSATYLMLDASASMAPENANEPAKEKPEAKKSQNSKSNNQPDSTNE